MPRRSTLDKITPTVRAALNRRLRAAAYGDLHALSAWLTDSGCATSKTQLGQYALKLRALDAGADAALKKLTPAERLRHAELRVSCLQAALASGPKANALDRAEEFADWAFNPTPKSSIGLSSKG